MNGALPESAGKPWSKFALAGPVLGMGGLAALAASAVGYRLGWWAVATALNAAQWAAFASALGLAASIAGAIRSRPGARRRGFVPALFGVAVSLPIVVVALRWEYAARAFPPINDISTDTQDPPVFWDMQNPSEYPGARMAALQRAAYPDLAPLALGVPPARAYTLALALAKAKGWEIVAAQAEEGRIEAVDRSFLYGFKDEVVVRIVASDDGARVDVRSRSRVGRIDRGVNAERIRAFLAALKVNAAKASE